MKAEALAIPFGMMCGVILAFAPIAGLVSLIGGVAVFGASILLDGNPRMIHSGARAQS